MIGGELPCIESLAEMIQQDLPEGVMLLPRDWEGETTRVMLKFAVSQQAVKNEKFDVIGFIKAKLGNSLIAIRHRRHIKELRLTNRLSMEIVDLSGQEKIKVYFHVEFANE